MIIKSYLKKAIVSLVSMMVITGCASRASSIAPAAIPSSNYKSISCADTKLMLESKRQEKATLINEQNNAAIGDTVGVLLVLLPVGSIFGADQEGKLAQAKGEVMALEGAARINCAS